MNSNNKKKYIISLLVVTISLLIFIIVYVKMSMDDYKSLFVEDQGEQTTIEPSGTIKETTTENDSDISPVVGNFYTNEEVINDNTTQVDNTVNDDDLPYDKLFITPERQSYENGELTLIIPTLDFKEEIMDGTDNTSLNLGPGLYEYAQLPGEGNRNVSIAAHRNTSRNGKIGEWFFYYIDTLTTGDYLYLVNKSNIYQYEYENTTVVDPYDWGPIYSQGYSCLTLTSCEPIGISTHRIIVLSKLIQTYPYSDTFDYISKK